MNKIKKWFDENPYYAGLFFFICSSLSLLSYYFYQNDISLSIFSAFLLSGISSFIYGIFYEKNSSVLDNYPILVDSSKYGFIGIKRKFPIQRDDNFEIYNDFIHSENVFIVLNDAKTFISNYAGLIEERLKTNRTGYTYLIVQNYNNIDSLNILGLKNKKKDSRNYYRDKILNLLRESQVAEFMKNKEQFIVRLNNNFMSTAQLLTDNYAMFSVYPNSSGKMSVPHFVFKNELNSQGYIYVKTDIDKLITESTEPIDFDSLKTEGIHKY